MAYVCYHRGSFHPSNWFIRIYILSLFFYVLLLFFVFFVFLFCVFLWVLRLIRLLNNIDKDRIKCERVRKQTVLESFPASIPHTKHGENSEGVGGERGENFDHPLS